MKSKRPTPELYVAFPKAIAALRDRISATEREIACWLFFDQIKAYNNVHELIDPPEIGLMGIALTNWTQASKESPPYVNALQGAYFLVSDIDSFNPKSRYISFGDLIYRWSALCKTEDAGAAFITSRISQDRLHDFAPGIGPTVLSQTLFTANIPHPPAEWAMFDHAEVEAIEASDFPEMVKPLRGQQLNPVDAINPAVPKPNGHQLGKQQRQEEEILSAIHNKGINPKQIPKWTPGTPGLKAEVQACFDIPGPIFQSTLTFDKAWERLRKGGENARIRDC